MAKDKLEEIPEIDLILGIKEKVQIVKYIEQFIKEKENQKLTYVAELKPQDSYTEFGIVTHTERTRAVIKIEDGCNQFCTYCIIPYARGRVRSRLPQNIWEEIRKVSEKGIKEVVLTGINLTVYGTDFAYKTEFQEGKEENSNQTNETLKDYRLIDLLEDINKIENIHRIRLGSLEPTIITEDFVKRLIKLEKVCDHFHLSLQSGCDETLKRMNRKYSANQIIEASNLIRKYYPNAALTADIIVGFPGETEEEFEKTYNLLKEIRLYKIHVFKYSKRAGTKAAIMQNQVDGNIKEQRSNKLIELSNQYETEFNNDCIGKTLTVLLEEKDQEYIKGHTTNYRTVKIDSKEFENKQYENKIVNVKITKEENLELIGTISHKK